MFRMYSRFLKIMLLSFQTGGILSILENESFVFEFNATDQDGDLLTYSILYGDDMQWFELNTITGTWFNS